MEAERLPFFVYGTLRTGERNHRLVEPYVAEAFEARLPGHRLYATASGGGLPVAVADPETPCAVTGEVYVVHQAHYDRALDLLDELEGVASGSYRRVPVRVQCRRAGAREWSARRAWGYLAGDWFDRRDGFAVPAGDWLARIPPNGSAA